MLRGYDGHDWSLKRVISIGLKLGKSKARSKESKRNEGAKVGWSSADQRSTRLGCSWRSRWRAALWQSMAVANGSAPHRAGGILRIGLYMMGSRTVPRGEATYATATGAGAHPIQGCCCCAKRSRGSESWNRFGASRLLAPELFSPRIIMCLYLLVRSSRGL